MSLRINGQYFVPVWAIVEVFDGTATGGLCKTCTGDKYCAPGLILFVHVLHKHQFKVCIQTHSLFSLMLSADPEDYSSAVRYNVTFCQTAVTDTQTPARSTVSSPILINITDDDFFEGVEYFQARIVETSDRFRVRIGRDTVNVTITDSESFSTSGNISTPDYS